ncbi:MAG TPA: hypothetical protein VF912_09430 [Anaeromyxobacter sp.]
MVLYRFLFAPVLLAIAVLSGAASKAPPPREARPTTVATIDAADAAGARASAARAAGAGVPERAARAVAHPATVR